MKLSHLNLSLILLFLLTLAACSKDDDNAGNNKDDSDPVKGKMTADIGENTFSSNNAVARYRSTGEFTISANTSTGQSLFFVIDNFIGAVDYSFVAGLSNTVDYSYEFNGSTQNFSTADGGAGVLTVTNYNESSKQISGIFTLTVLQVTNPGSSLQITKGTFTDVPITTLKEPESGTMAYYVDDTYYSTSTPELNLSVAINMNFQLTTPETDMSINLTSSGSALTPNFGYALLISGADVDYYFIEVTDYMLIDGKVSLKLKSPEDLDFELWIKDYPVEESYPLGEPGLLTFYTDTATFTSTSITITDFENEINSQWIKFSAENSNGSSVYSTKFPTQSTIINFEFIDAAGTPHLIPFSGDAKLVFDDSGTSISYFGYVTANERFVIVGRDLPL